MSSSRVGHVRITKTVVDKLEPGEVRWDSEVRGFGVRCQRQAKKYVLKTRMNGRQRWFTIGEHGSPWTPDGARKEALSLLADIHKGTDIASLRAPSRQQPIIADLCERYLQEHAYRHKKASSAAEDKRNIDSYRGRRQNATFSNCYDNHGVRDFTDTGLGGRITGRCYS